MRPPTDPACLPSTSTRRTRGATRRTSTQPRRELGNTQWFGKVSASRTQQQAYFDEANWEVVCPYARQGCNFACTLQKLDKHILKVRSW